MDNIKKFQNEVLFKWSHFINKQKALFENTHHLMPEDNHKRHNKDPEYWNILLKDVTNNPTHWVGKKALDFGCGCGRNIENLLNLADFDKVDGCDISLKNAEYSQKYIDNIFGSTRCKTWENDGYTLRPAKDNTYDFVMSHIVFQHIPNYDVRYSILLDIHRVLTKGGVASLHYMDLVDNVKYYENSQQLKNCVVENSDFLINDFKKIGFVDVSCTVSTDMYAMVPSYYIRGIKQ